MEAVNEKELCLEEIPSSVLFCLWLYGHAQVIDGLSASSFVLSFVHIR
jgi:hypothetical protein